MTRNWHYSLRGIVPERRAAFNGAARQVLNREFELYELRKFFATWMISRGVPESIVNTLQGRAPPSEHRYLWSTTGAQDTKSYDEEVLRPIHCGAYSHANSLSPSPNPIAARGSVFLFIILNTQQRTP